MLKEKGIELDEYKDMTIADIYHYNDKNVESISKKKRIGF